ncbi:tyrosinase family oxidase copper chaperone [Lentzea flava]|uniref:tyrosinase family oxidase copper chaperone n=1 Tax=Lentzea flava TaxID=103732 RepID=UPI00166FE95D|nr:tyrosinase family oxidase copper chaperone [Lentzea flava]
MQEPEEWTSIPNRRHFLSLAVLGVAGVAFAVPVVVAARGKALGIEHFDDIYQGRRIQGLVAAGHERHLPPVDHYRPVRSLTEVAHDAADLLRAPSSAPAITGRGAGDEERPQEPHLLHRS